MSGVPSAKTKRLPVTSRKLCGSVFSAFAFLTATHARTTPATLFRSAIPMAFKPSAAACNTISAGCEAPRKKE